MVPSLDTEDGSVNKATKSSAENGPKEQRAGSGVEATGQAQKKPKAVNGSQQKQEPVEGSKEGRLSGKEMKEKAKAEKAARRAKEKQGQQGQSVADLGSIKQVEQKLQKAVAGGAASSSSAPKVQDKGNTQKLPLRPPQSQAPPVAREPEKENKNVALFEHLYGPPRRTTIAGAGKDVHPAILALGLQMRNYEICGSSARCVATLLAFKRVRDFFGVQNSLLIPPSSSKPTPLHLKPPYHATLPPTSPLKSNILSLAAQCQYQWVTLSVG